MDLFDMIRAHWQWRVRLRLSLQGLGEPLEEASAAEDDACELGSWLNGEGRRHERLAAYAELRAAHAHFHEAAAEIMHLARAGDRAGALALMESEGRFEHASNATVLAILKLMRDVEPIEPL